MPRFPTGVVVVGGSAAGLSAADGLREGGYTGSVIVLDENLEPGFDRTALSKGLLAADGDQRPPTSLRTPERLADRRITVLSGHRAMGLDVDRHLVVTSWGEAIPWEHVIIATGVDARRMTTTAGNSIPALRGLCDLEVARTMFNTHRPVAGIGGGFIGLEVAAGLSGRGIEVTVFDPLALPQERAVGRDLATWLLDLHRARGVRFELGSGVTAVDETAGGYLITTADGRSHQAASLLAGVGTEPNTDWLIGSGVELADGVVTDVAGRANIPHVWAAGDVAAELDVGTGRYRRFEHWTRAIEQGRHVGLNIARGEAVPFAGLPYVWTEHYERTLHVFGERRPGDEDTVAAGSLASGEFVVVHGSGGKLHAVTISGFPTAIRTYKKLLKAGAGLTQALAAAQP
jgi:NADPH-dependent 2,4-dienoyl-CoA reductase/sulfur reductase-like enzyme